MLNKTANCLYYMYHTCILHKYINILYISACVKFQVTKTCRNWINLILLQFRKLSTECQETERLPERNPRRCLSRCSRYDISYLASLPSHGSSKYPNGNFSAENRKRAVQPRNSPHAHHHPYPANHSMCVGNQWRRT